MAIQPVEQGSAFAFRNVINNNFYELKVLSGASKPTQSTVAVVGQMYLDTSEGKMYFCSNVSGSTYTWKPFASDMSASNVSYNNGSSGMSSENVQDAIDELFTSASNGKELIADAIAGKGVPTSADDTYATMAENIEKIETGIDISDATLTAASELKKDIVAYSKTGKRIVGSLGNGSVGAPSISISVTENNSKAEIKATTSYTSGIIGTDSTSSVKSLNVQQGTTITPGTSQKTAVATGKYTTGPVYVAGDSDLVPSNIKNGVNIFGVSGSYTGEATIGYITSIGRVAENRLIFNTNITLRDNIVGSVQLYGPYPNDRTFLILFNPVDYTSTLTVDTFGLFAMFPPEDYDIVGYPIYTKDVSIYDTYFDVTFSALNDTRVGFPTDIELVTESESFLGNNNGRVIATYD